FDQVIQLSISQTPQIITSQLNIYISALCNCMKHTGNYATLTNHQMDLLLKIYFQKNHSFIQQMNDTITTFLCTLSQVIACFFPKNILTKRSRKRKIMY